MRHHFWVKTRESPLFIGVRAHGKKNNREDVGKNGEVIDELSTGSIQLFIISKLKVMSCLLDLGADGRWNMGVIAALGEDGSPACAGTFGNAVRDVSGILPM